MVRVNVKGEFSLLPMLPLQVSETVYIVPVLIFAPLNIHCTDGQELHESAEGQEDDTTITEISTLDPDSDVKKSPCNIADEFKDPFTIIISTTIH